MTGRSNESDLIQFNDFIHKVIKDNDHVDAFFSDFSRAFDSVNHDLLIRKLHNFGIRGTLLNWLNSYLVDWFAQVIIKNVMSSQFRVLSGVPQGSQLGPHLFIIFINDITEVIKYSNILLFTDDAKLYKRINNDRDVGQLQRDIRSLNDLGTRNIVDLNINKWYVMNFSKRNYYVPSYSI